MANRKIVNVDDLDGLGLAGIIANQNFLMARIPLVPWIGAASFQGANAASLPALDSGQTWTVDTGAFQILNRVATPTTSTNSRALTDSGVTDHWAQIQVVAVPNSVQHWLIGRAADALNYYRVGYSTGDNRLIVQKIVAGAATELGAVPAADALATTAGVLLGARFVGTTIETYLNGKKVHTITDTTHTTGTKVGFQANASGAQFRNFTERTS